MAQHCTRTGYGFIERFGLLDEFFRRGLEGGKVALGLIEFWIGGF